MSLLNKLTIHNLKLNKNRTIVTIVGIMLSVALITAVASVYASGLQSLINYETNEKGMFHVAFFDVPVEEVKILENNRSVETVNLTESIGYAIIDSKNESKPYVCVKGFTKDSLENLSVKLVDGRFPENDGEILIPTHLKTNGRVTLAVGDEVVVVKLQQLHLILLAAAACRMEAGDVRLAVAQREVFLTCGDGAGRLVPAAVDVYQIDHVAVRSVPA